MDLDDWLDDQRAPEADWGSVVLKRAMTGALGDGGDGLLFDLLALTQPYACRPHLCTPGRRSKTARSCCADLDVSIAPQEAVLIDASLPRIASAMADDPRWQQGPPQWRQDGIFVKKADPGSRRKRCIFAQEQPDGLRCGLHRVELEDGLAPGSLKPLPCRLFPLALVELGNGSRLLTAVHRNTATHLATRPARVFPCLSAGAPPLYEDERTTITSLFGEQVWQDLCDAATAYLSDDDSDEWDDDDSDEWDDSDDE